MAKRILFSSKDESYLMSLALKFYAKLDENIEVTIVTDFGYLSEYINGGFATEKILVIDKEFYFDTLNYSVFETVIVLDENQENNSLFNNNVICINKFMSTDYIFDCITSHTILKEEVLKHTSKDTKVIAIYSPIGGVGKSTVAYGICCAFAKAYKRALYVNINGLQDFGDIFNSVGSVSTKIERYISYQDEKLKDELGELTEKYIFDYIKPIRMSMFSVGISLKNYGYLIDLFVKSKEYDYIVLDMISEFNKETITLIGQSDKVICVGQQDKQSAFRFKKMIDNIDTSDSNKYLFVCNKYDRRKENHLCDLNGNIRGNCFIKEYIDFVPETTDISGITNCVINQIEQVTAYCM